MPYAHYNSVNKAAQTKIAAKAYMLCRESHPSGDHSACLDSYRKLKALIGKSAALKFYREANAKLSGGAPPPSGAVKPCSQMTGAHLQHACQTAREYGTGYSPNELQKWMAAVGYDVSTQTYDMNAARVYAGKETSTTVPSAGTVPGAPTAPSAPSGAGAEVPDYMVAAEETVMVPVDGGFMPASLDDLSSGGLMETVKDNKLLVGGVAAAAALGLFFYLRR